MKSTVVGLGIERLRKSGRLSFVLGLLLAVSLVSCAPRGESKSLAEVLETAKERYAVVKDQAQSSAVEADLKVILVELAAVEKGRGVLVESGANKVAVTLNKLIEHAGYTSRPALTELMNQYLHVAEHGSENADATLLLASRTYSLLASELETTKFGV